MIDARAINHSFPLPSLFTDARKVGERKYKVKCCAHEDTNPSMVVDYKRDHGWRAHCFSCNWDGSAIDVVMKLRDCGFLAAVALMTDGKPIEPPPDLHRRPAIVLVCDGCGNSTWEATSKTYERGGPYDVPAVVEVRARAENAGWRMRGERASCLKCEEMR